MNRRSAMAVLGAAPLVGLLGGCAANEKRKLSGFVVADAHVGWPSAAQPAPELQSQMMAAIVERFPHVDLFVDVGDAYHGQQPAGQKARARRQWLGAVSGQVSGQPYFYVPGNHELQRGMRFPKPQVRAAGSLPGRSYYSFDLWGIHFIALPQLVDTALTSEETLDWLRLDLSLNTSNTTIVFAHNAPSNTTFNNDETAYREIINSSTVLSLLREHPNVVAWIHGHNHVYDVMETDGLMVACAGRIGGFRPSRTWGPYAQAPIGGLYFEIGESGLTLDGYSAEHGQFLRELGHSHASGKLERRITLDPGASPRVSAGAGLVQPNERIDLANHFTGERVEAEVYLHTQPQRVLNDNHDFRLPTDLIFSGKTRRKSIGYRVTPRRASWERLPEGGLRIRSPAAGGTTTLWIPFHRIDTEGQRIRGGGVRAVAGNRYTLRLEFGARPESLSIRAVAQILDASYEVIQKTTANQANLELGATSATFATTVKSDLDASDLSLQWQIEFPDLNGPVDLRAAEIRAEGPDASILSPAIGVGAADIPLKQDGDIYRGDATRALSSSHQQTITPKLPPHQLATILVRWRRLEWQVRNATVIATPGELHIRRRIQPTDTASAIELSPLAEKSGPYVERLIGVDEATVRLYRQDDRSLAIHVLKPEDASAARPTALIRSLTSPQSADSQVFVTTTATLYEVALSRTGPTRLEFPNGP